MLASPRSLCLYAVTDRSWLGQRTLSQVVEEALRGGVTFLQLREKGVVYEELFSLGKKIQPLAKKYKVPFVVNDSIEVAVNLCADGVHIGPEDMGVAEARRLIGPDMILGATAKTVKQAVQAQQEGADYLGVGAVFPSVAKPEARGVSQAVLREICRVVDIPVVAIGGINAKNITGLCGSGLYGVAVISALFAQDDVELAARHMRALAESVASS